MSSVDESKKPEASADPQAGCCEGPVRDWFATAEKCAHDEPVKCAAFAFLAGFLFTVLPVGQIVGGVVRLVLGLVRPALVLLGAMKLFEEIEKRRKP